MKKKNRMSDVWLFPAALAVLLCFLAAVEQVADEQKELGKTQLEDALHRASAACYAAEGVYPPDLGYLLERYGVHYNERDYVVIYQPVASNLMPDITVLEREP